jgi:arylsulfatase A-like enzyme
MCGADIKEDNEIEGAHITDITPTLLHLLGEPIPADMDGKVLFEAFDGGIKATRESRCESGEPAMRDSDYNYTEEERRAVEGRLRDLGYMD